MHLKRPLYTLNKILHINTVKDICFTGIISALFRMVLLGKLTRIHSIQKKYVSRSYVFEFSNIDTVAVSISFPTVMQQIFKIPKCSEKTCKYSDIL